VPVKLHRCRIQWAKLDAHPCWRVEKALIDMGVDYERVPGPVRRSKRQAVEELSGQRQYPVIELEDGTVWREESKQMAAAIRGGKLATTA
jgi:glutathione S-transferase